MLAIVVCGTFFLTDDLPASRPGRVDPAEEAVVTGTAVRQEGEVKVRYRHPLTEQVVVAPLHVGRAELRPEPGEEVAVVAQRDDPLSVAVEGDAVPVTASLLGYGLWIGAAALPALARRTAVRRAERLAAGPDPTFAMSGALVGWGRLSRCHLELYALDAPAGAEPLCSVRVLTTGQAPVAGRTFPVEVKGSPRPFGRVVAQTRGGVLWPAGRALGLGRGHGRPEATGGPPTPLVPTPPPAAPWRPRRLPFFEVAAWSGVAAVVQFGLVLAVTLSNAAEAEEASRQGTPVVAEVVGHEAGDRVVVLRYQSDGGRTVRAPADFADDYPVGIRYPIVLDPDDPARARLITEPYDVVEPLAWGALPVAVALWWLARRWATWRRNLRVARRGPWWQADGKVLESNGRVAVVGVRAGRDVVAAVPVSPPPPVPGPAQAPVVVAGDLDPGTPAALWWDGREPVTSIGATVVPGRV